MGYKLWLIENKILAVLITLFTTAMMCLLVLCVGAIMVNERENTIKK